MSSKRYFISAEQFDEIQAKVRNLAKQEENQVVGDLLKKAEMARAVSDLYIAEQHNDKLKTAKIAGNLLFFFIKNNMACFDKEAEEELKSVWEKEFNYKTKPTEMFLEFLFYYQNSYFAKDFINYRGMVYAFVSIYVSGYDPYSFLLEMIKEKESEIDLKKWASDRVSRDIDEPFCENRGAVSEEEALEIFYQEIKSDLDIEISLDGVDLINGVFVVGYFLKKRNEPISDSYYHEFSVKQVDKVDYEKCKRNESEGE